MKEQICLTCAIADKQKRACKLNGMPIDLDTDFCSHHRKEIEYCEICHRPMLNGCLEYDKNDKLHLFCEKCNLALSTCELCPNHQKCAFETDPNPMPKYVIKTVRQGNMQMQSQVLNEERMKLFCPNCECWHESSCYKQFGIGCNNKIDFWTSQEIVTK